ncbi:hypothetical protein VN97_g10430 [Penicillium thymicola]|uniref:Uncharacterized protein n=1 Tax=Penicillium thymicola TaxID=293382 RepID=A0AAI9X3U3_PENTH|nr:hypothetical protein VN97_g10430 [Penicillium thymicola]
MLHILHYTPLGISLLSPTSSQSWETATIQPYLSTRHLGNITSSWGIILVNNPTGLGPKLRTPITGNHHLTASALNADRVGRIGSFTPSRHFCLVPLVFLPSFIDSAALLYPISIHRTPYTSSDRARKVQRFPPIFRLVGLSRRILARHILD